ncbi:MAG: trypsin-like peptidase domain-containing protein [Clostridia bacterium]|nr:trypsin-like peptidase domain-containing protein [Clostridia bacterium]
MKKKVIISVISLACICCLAIGLIPAGADTSVISEEEIGAIVNTQTDTSLISSPFTEAVSQVRDSVVGINNYQTQSSSYGYGFGFGFGGDYGRQPSESLYGTGSGVVITSYGHVLTNYHVVEGASRITVTTSADSEEHEAVLLGYDASLDIAILQVNGLNVKPVKLGDSDALQVGEWAIVIGNPLGEKFARTVTVGIVSAVDRQVTDTSYDRYYRRYTTTNTMIQVDAAINSGNSGGGMFNMLGQLMGIPARKYSSNSFIEADVDNIGMCIPINVAKPLIEEVLRGHGGQAASAAPAAGNNGTDTSMLNKPRLGVTVATLSSSATVKLPLGAFVREVDENSPAAEAGIRKGDVIVAVNGTDTPSASAVIGMLQGLKEGDVVTVKVYRANGAAEAIRENTLDLNAIDPNGEYIDIQVTLRVIENQSSFIPAQVPAA